MRYVRLYSVVFCTFLALLALDSPRARAEKPETTDAQIQTRVFFQDDEARTVRWANLLAGKPPRLGPVSVVEGFPKLDAQRQKLVQMRAIGGLLLVGVRDDDAGGFQSGWVLIEMGVEGVSHGDHGHWTYPRPPRVRAAQLDDKQGNLAHVYVYGKSFYVAQDKLGGYTVLDAASIRPADAEAEIRQKTAFHAGGGGHITLAASGGLGFVTWIDRQGENAGRVDVTPLRPTGNTQVQRSFTLPSGGIHGATAAEGKVFFAPSDGVCWVSAAEFAKDSAEPPKVQHLSLGKQGEQPVRTGGFTNFGRHVAFTTGGGETACLCLLDASRPSPEVVRIRLPMAEGNRPAGLAIAKPYRASPLAFVFHDHAADEEAPDKLSLVTLDPNLDGQFDDAALAQELTVGRALVEGHGGHHAVAFDADRRWAVFSNSGDGALSLFSLAERKVVASFSTGGAPSALIAAGGAADENHP